MDAFQKGVLGYLIFLAGLLLVVFALSGCSTYDKFSARTIVSYEPDTGKIMYDSTKDQMGFEAGYERPDGAKAYVKTDSAKTSEAVVAAALQSQAKTAELLGRIFDALAPLLQQLAKPPVAAPPKI